VEPSASSDTIRGAKPEGIADVHDGFSRRLRLEPSASSDMLSGAKPEGIADVHDG